MKPAATPTITTTAMATAIERVLLMLVALEVEELEVVGATDDVETEVADELSGARLTSAVIFQL